MPVSIPFPTGWTLRQRRRPDGAPAVADVGATVPGCTHTDLLAAGIIPDPFDETHEADVAWVADCDWQYRTEIELGAEILDQRHVELVVDGLDTLATIRVNGRVVGRTANMHRRHRFDIRAAASDGTNTIEIDLRSATRFADERQAAEGAWPSANFGRPFNQIRKMACSWGWDWGPWLTSAGIWRPGAIVGWSDGRLGDVRPRPLVDGDDRGRVIVEVDVVDPVPGASVRATLAERRKGGPATATTDVAAGDGTVELVIDAGAVTRWWPHSLGRPVTYDLRIELLAPDGAPIDTTTRRIGFRTIELDTAPDATGSAFTIVVNGLPMFVRGVNWIPDDVFPSRISHDDYRARIDQAIEAGVDLVRVWGGGIYEDDRFHDLCDELGVLVWHDFLFACAAYPEHLLADEVAAEARDNVSRLMSHPSLAIWNGNNENLWGHADWGWQRELDGRSWGAGFYHELLPAVCAELDPERPYWPGSPYSGSDALAPNADAHGCTHVWDVWNELDLDRYRDHTPRFVAEFGWQAPPVRATYDAHVSGGVDRSSDAWRSHQKADDGDLKLDRGIRARFGIVDDPDEFWYAAQTVQARAVRTGVEHFRSLRPHCMGTIWWQLNDCWPVTSWSVVDGDGRRKPAWFALREAYRDRLLTVQPRGDRLVAVAVNETPDAWELDGAATLLDLTGATIAECELDLSVPPRAARFVVLPAEVAAPADPTDAVLVVEGGGTTAWWWFAPDHQLRLRRPRWSIEIVRDIDAITIAVSPDVVVRDLTLHVDRLDPSASIDRQVVDLRPGIVEQFRIGGVASRPPAELEVALLSPPVCRSVVDLVGPA